MRILFTLLFAGFVLASAYTSYKKPTHDWDMLAYSAISYQSSGWEKAHIHEYLYDTLLPSLPAGTEAFLTTKPNEISCAANPDFFFQQIPFYTIKPGYNLLVQFITDFVSSPLQAMTIISVLSYILVCFFIWLWLKQYLNHTWACLAALGISALPLLIEQGRIFTPDALSSLLTISALFFLYEKKRWYISYPLLLASVFVRPDNIVMVLLVAAFCIYRYYTYQGKINIPSIALACLSVAAYFTIAIVYKGYGWKITFLHSIVDLDAAPAYWAKMPLPVPLYFTYLIKGFLTFKMRWVFTFFLLALSYFSIRKSNPHPKTFMEILITLSLLMLAKFLAFPIFDERYYVVQYIMAMMVICIAIFPRKNGHTVNS